MDEKRKNREAFLNSMRDYQWDLHLRKTAQIAKQENINNFTNISNTLELLKSMQKDNLNFSRSGPATFSELDLASLGEAFPVLTQGPNDINFDNVARTVLGSNNVISREREASGMMRRFIAHVIDCTLMLSWMFGWIYYFYLNNIFVLSNLSKFINEDWDDILENSLIEPSADAAAPNNNNNFDPFDVDNLDYLADNIDLEKLADGFLNSKHINGIEDDLLLFTTFYKIMSIIYESVFIWYFGCTLGKKLVGIEVVHYSSFAAGGGNGVNATPDVMVIHNSNMTFLRSFIRTIIKTMYFTIAFPLIFFVTPFSTVGTQFYDRLTRTMVVKKLRGNQ